MIAIRPEDIFGELLSLEKVREQIRLIYSSPEKRRPTKTDTPGRWKIPQEERRVWKIRSPSGKSEGPFAIEELLSNRYFTPLIRVQNTQEGVEAAAGEFPQIRTAIRNQYRKKPVNPAMLNICPRCRTHLKERIYEGVTVRVCPECRGKLVDSARIGRILARKEIGFSQKLKDRAEEFRHNFIRNPIQPSKIRLRFKKDIFCPQCTTKMLVRPFNYNYFVPVDKCLTCGNIWFDTDELEILQILVEDR